jgi:hypothetical protein
MNIGVKYFLIMLQVIWFAVTHFEATSRYTDTDWLLFAIYVAVLAVWAEIPVKKDKPKEEE